MAETVRVGPSSVQSFSRPGNRDANTHSASPACLELPHIAASRALSPLQPLLLTLCHSGQLVHRWHLSQGPAVPPEVPLCVAGKRLGCHQQVLPGRESVLADGGHADKVGAVLPQDPPEALLAFPLG